MFLDGDSLGFSMMSHRAFTLGGGEPEEQLFQRLCECAYLRQSRRRHVDPRPWGGFRAMWLRRPRVRTNGFYVMATEVLKSTTRDMFAQSDPLAGSILTTRTFRYFRFFADGSVLYALTHHPPERMVKLLASHPPRGASAAAARAARNLQEGREAPPQVIKGTYSIEKRSVFAAVRSHYNIVNFHLEVSHGRRGHFVRLAIIQHFSKGLAPGSHAVKHPESRGYSFWFLRAYPHSL